MAIIKTLEKQLREERMKNARLRAELDREKEKVAFLGVLCDVDIDGVFEQEVESNGES